MAKHALVPTAHLTGPPVCSQAILGTCKALLYSLLKRFVHLYANRTNPCPTQKSAAETRCRYGVACTTEYAAASQKSLRMCCLCRLFVATPAAPHIHCRAHGSCSKQRQ